MEVLIRSLDEVYKDKLEKGGPGSGRKTGAKEDPLDKNPSKRKMGRGFKSWVEHDKHTGLYGTPGRRHLYRGVDETDLEKGIGDKEHELMHKQTWSSRTATGKIVTKHRRKILSRGNVEGKLPLHKEPKSGFKLSDGTNVRIYDLGENGPADRYVAVLDSQDWRESTNPGYMSMLSFSGNPTHPQGVSQFGEGKEGAHLGKRIQFSSLPKDLQDHVIQRVTVEAEPDLEADEEGGARPIKEEPEKKETSITKKHPDTSAGAIQSLKEQSDLKTEGATARPDPSVEGVWMVTLPKEGGRKAIVYLAGYKEPAGSARKHNDFEVEDEPPKAKEKDIPYEHQLSIAKKTLKMPDAMVGVMGGMSKKEAQEFMRKHNAKETKKSMDGTEMILTIDEAHEELQKSKEGKKEGGGGHMVYIPATSKRKAHYRLDPREAPAKPTAQVDIPGTKEHAAREELMEKLSKIRPKIEAEGPSGKYGRLLRGFSKVKKSEITDADVDWAMEIISKAKVTNPGALAAWIGRKKYGASKMSEMSAKARKRGKAPKGKARQRLGGGGRFAKLEGELAKKSIDEKIDKSGRGPDKLSRMDAQAQAKRCWPTWSRKS